MNYKALASKLTQRSVLILLLVNIYPIIGVFLFNWDYLIIVLLYISETVIIGLINVFKIAIAEGVISDEDKKKYGITDTDDSQQNKTSETSKELKAFLIPFFMFHFIFFVYIQTEFVLALSGGISDKTIELEELLNFDFILNILLLAASHLYTFYFIFVKKKQYKTASPALLMFDPYKRIIIQQVTVIFGSLFIMITNAPIFFLIFLILMKIYFDLRVHFKFNDPFKLLV